MVTNTMPPRTRSAPNGSAPPTMRISPNKPRRNSPLIAVGVLLMVGCGLIAAVLQMRATSKTSVLAVAHQVPAGQLVKSSDLSTVTISGGTGLRAIAAADSAVVVGKTAAVTLMPGTLVTRSELAGASSVTRGKVVIGLSLKPGQVPTSNLRAGDQVLVVATGAAAQLADPSSASSGSNSNSPQGAVLVRRATVFSVDGSSRNNDNTSVSILVDEADAPAIAGAGAANLVTLVLQSAP
jgi:hypothetical protein